VFENVLRLLQPLTKAMYWLLLAKPQRTTTAKAMAKQAVRICQLLPHNREKDTSQYSIHQTR
jgi:hypothetical protein